jgi:preprotein translocase subunit SecG
MFGELAGLLKLLQSVKWVELGKGIIEFGKTLYDLFGVFKDCSEGQCRNLIELVIVLVIVFLSIIIFSSILKKRKQKKALNSSTQENNTLPKSAD